MAAPAFATEPLTADEYELLAATETAAGWAAWDEGRIKTAVRLWLSAARWSQYAGKARRGETR